MTEPLLMDMMTDAMSDTLTEALPSEAAAMKAKVLEASAFLKTLANPDRLLLACALVEGERSVGELETLLGIRQPGLSQQLAGLRDAGLITGRKEGKQVFYRLADPRVETFISTMHGLFCAAPPTAEGETP